MEENVEMCQNKMKVSRDPMSHRIIEKRRRDRMNSCLADLSRLIPATYLKKGRGRIEKTEIIELAIKHLKQLQAVLYNRKLEHTLDAENNQKSFINKEQFYLGYQECLHETTCYLVENEGLLLGDPLCVRLLNHLNQHGKNISNKSNLHSGESMFFCGNNVNPNLESGCNSLESFGDVENDDSQQFRLKRSSPRYSSSPVINADSVVYDCAETCMVQQGQPLVLNANNVAKMEKFRWQGVELAETQPLKSSIVETEGDVGNIGGMSTCSRSSTIRSDEVFKYKTNIKERFNADQKVSKSDSDADETDDFTSSEEQIRRKKRSSDLLQTVPNKRRLSSSGTEDIGTGRNNVMIDKSRDLTDFDNKMRVPAIPIFALHPKGSYYVPMTVDSSLVLPQLKALNHFPSAMHHIEISVSFASEFVGVNPLITRTK